MNFRPICGMGDTFPKQGMMGTTVVQRSWRSLKEGLIGRQRTETKNWGTPSSGLPVRDFIEGASTVPFGVVSEVPSPHIVVAVSSLQLQGSLVPPKSPGGTQAAGKGSVSCPGRPLCQDLCGAGGFYLRGWWFGANRKWWAGRK